MGARHTIEDCENAFGNSKVVGPIRRIRLDAPGYRGVPPLVVIDFITLMVIGYFPWKDRGPAPNRRAMPDKTPLQQPSIVHASSVSLHGRKRGRR